MFIKYNGTNVHALPYINKAQAHIMQSPQDVKWLRPGWNEFPKEVWEQNKEHPAIKKMLKKGTIELLNYKASLKVRDKKSGRLKKVVKMLGQDDKPIKLKHFDEPTALKIIKGTLNREILERWLDEERRHKIKRALRKQIKPLLPSMDDDDERDQEDLD